YADIFPADFQCCFLSAEEMYDPDTGKCLRNNCRKGSSPDIHIKSENKDRIQDNIGNCTDQYRKHSRLCKSLSSDKGIHSQCYFYKQGSKCVDIHIAYTIVNRILTCAECHQEVSVPDQKNHCQDNGNNNLKRKAVSQDLFCCFIIFSSH